MQPVREAMSEYPKDTYAHSCAVDRGLEVTRLPYFSWRGKKGGPERNQAMLEVLLAWRLLEREVCVEAFPLPGSVGTEDMIARARAHGVEVRVHGAGGYVSKRFVVRIPITGFISIEVAAGSKKEAIREAWRQYHETGVDDFDIEWEATSIVAEGNVTHAMLNEEHASEVRGGEET